MKRSRAQIDVRWLLDRPVKPGEDNCGMEMLESGRQEDFSVF
jgi:hypothetical protein